MRKGTTPFLHLFAIAALVLSWCPIAAAETLALDIKEAKAEIDQRTHEPIVVIVLIPGSARIFAEVTGKNVGKTMDIRVDSRSVLKSVIREPILGGTLNVSGHFSRQEVDDIVARLSSGAAKLEFEVGSSN